jgi:hypothetical protein
MTARFGSMDRGVLLASLRGFVEGTAPRALRLVEVLMQGPPGWPQTGEERVAREVCELLDALGGVCRAFDSELTDDISRAVLAAIGRSRQGAQ